MVRFEEASFQGVGFCEVLGCSLGFALRLSDETAIRGFYENEHRRTTQILGCILGNHRIATL